MNLTSEPGSLVFAHGLEASREGTQFCFFFTVRDVFECQQDEVTAQRAATNSAVRSAIGLCDRDQQSHVR